MTDDKEIEALVAKARAMGATVTILRQLEREAGRLTGRNPIQTVQVAGLKGVGPYPMSPIAAAERLRKATRAAA